MLFVITAGCGSQHKPDSTDVTPEPMPQQSQFTVHDVFYIAPPVDSVIATGVVDAGTFRVGDAIVVAGDIESTIGKIESIQQGEIQQASAGDNVGFHLIGVERGQVNSGDKVVRDN